MSVIFAQNCWYRVVKYAESSKGLSKTIEFLAKLRYTFFMERWNRFQINSSGKTGK